MASRILVVLLYMVVFSEICICTELGSTADQEAGGTPPSKSLQDSSPPDGTATEVIAHSAFLKAGNGDGPLERAGEFGQQQHRSKLLCPDGCRDLPGVQVCCGHRGCTNIMRNRFHCGACHRPCRFGHACCDGICVDTLNDRNHCGRCRTPCFPGVDCFFGMCGYGLA
ncbi:unnamed protein product [Victoria cruziana]